MSELFLKKDCPFVRAVVLLLEDSHSSLLGSPALWILSVLQDCGKIRVVAPASIRL